MQEQQYELQRRVDNPIDFVASTDQDAMYYHQVMSEPDWEHFQESVQKEINDHKSNHHWKVIPIKEVPEGLKILGMVWLDEKKEMDRHQRDIQMESLVECAWWATRVWCQLMGHICAHHELANT